MKEAKRSEVERLTHRVEIAHEGRWWNAYVPEIDYTTQGRHISEAEDMARDLIASAEDVPADSFDLDVRITKPDDVAAQLAEADALERTGHDAVRNAARVRRRAARTLRERYGMSVIDVAAVLGVTRARVYQLLEESAGDEAETAAVGPGR